MLRGRSQTVKVNKSRPYRPVHSSNRRCFATTKNIPSTEEFVSFSFVEQKDDSIRIDVRGKKGATVLEVALDHNIDIEGACGGEMACSTCHVILSQKLYDRLPKKSEEEQDMLDLAWGIQPT